MGESTSKEFDNSLRRIFLLLQGMAEDTLESLKTGNQQLVAHMHDVDINLDKFHDYCIRILNRSGNKDQRKTNILFTTLYILELIGDEFKRISHHILFDFKQKTNFKNICSLAEITKQLLDTFYDLFYKFDKGKIEHMSQVDRELYTTVGTIYKKSSEEEKEIYHHLRVIGRYINALVELRIEMEF
jgi:phosphate uptake regulator